MGDSRKAIDEKEGQKADLLKIAQKYRKSRKIKKIINEINYKRLNYIDQLDLNERIRVSHSFIRLIDEQMDEMSRILNLDSEQKHVLKEAILDESEWRKISETLDRH